MFDAVCYSKRKRKIVTGTEFDTYERIDGAIVYGKYINFGTLPNTTTKNVAHGISSLNTTKIVSVTGTAATASVTLPLPFALSTLASNIGLQADATNITITTGSDRSALSAPRILIKYMK